jgi:class 3 adenylate cyclase
LAAPGEVITSQTVRDLTAGSGIVFTLVGERELKGLPDLWRVYRAQTA